MKFPKLIAPALVVAAMAVSPASAAPATTNGSALRQDIAQLDRQIDRARDRQTISAREAASLDRQVRTLDQTWRAYARGGFTRAETRTLENRIAQLRRELQRETRDDNRRDDNRRDDNRTPNRR